MNAPPPGEPSPAAPAAPAARAAGAARPVEGEVPLQIVADALPQLVWTTDAQGYHDYFNRRWYEYTGLTPEACAGDGWRQAFHPDDMVETERRWRRSLATGEPYETEYRCRRHDGRWRWFLGRALPVRDAEGRVLRWFGTCTDIDDQKRVEAALAESESRFRNMADHAPVMLWVTDPGGRCTYLNRKWYEFTGRPEVMNGLGTGWLDATHPDDRPLAARAFAAANARREPFRVEYRLRCADGSYRWAIDSASPRFGPGGELLGYVGSVIDISERKRVEQEREGLLHQEQAARRAAEEASRLKDEFLATVSHELRTPLNAMLGWLQMLRAGGLAPPQQEHALATVERNARAQAQLVEDLLDVSRIVSGKLRLEVAPVDLAAVVEQALESARPAANAKGVRLETAAPAGPCVVTGDAARLQQIVWNLLSNAVKFTPEGGRVEVRLGHEGAHAVLRVADTGRGIEPDFLPHVFERFRQAEGGATRRVGGLGLGLAIVRHLAEMHGGTVGAESEGEGRGATFTVRLPLVRHALAESGRPRPPPPGLGLPCSPELAGLRVLVVDDEPDARDLVRALLEGCGARVSTAASAAEALELLRAERPDVLVSDLAMPHEDGYDLIRKVRALPPDEGGRTPALALTAYARAQDRTRVLLAGFGSHVPKPVEPLELIAVIVSLTGHLRRPPPPA
ncbi:MAG TPA: PAS domain-containing protein [Polyangiaceae bacterium]|nr:PAS domain-containing protein [Polyangiaceae bacterium]